MRVRMKTFNRIARTPVTEERNRQLRGLAIGFERVAA